MNDQDDNALLRQLGQLSDSDLLARLQHDIGSTKTMPSIRVILDRLCADHKVEHRTEPFMDTVDDTEAVMQRVLLKPPSGRVFTVAASSSLRAARIALILWMQYDPAATSIVRKVVRT